jgi:ADP-ribosylglycohydrolase
LEKSYLDLGFLGFSNKSKMDLSKQVQSCIKGLVFGQAVGEAIGIPAKGKTRQDITKSVYDKGVYFPYKHSVRGFDKGDWGNYTDQSIIIIQTLTAKPFMSWDDYQQFIDITPYLNKSIKPDIDRKINYNKNANLEQLFAFNLKTWVQQGFAEIGDSQGAGCDSVSIQLDQLKDFADDPISMAEYVAKKYPSSSASNTAVARTAVLGAIPDFRLAMYLTERFCRCTHYDDRCVVSCIVVVSMTHMLMNREKEYDAHKMLEIAIAIGARRLENSTQTLPKKTMKMFVAATTFKSLNDLQLDNPENEDNTFLPLACGIYAFKRITEAPNVATYKDVLNNIVLRGGNSCANASVAGAIMGTMLGFAGLPANWISPMKHFGWLKSKCRHLTDSLEELQGLIHEGRKTKNPRAIGKIKPIKKKVAKKKKKSRGSTDSTTPGSDTPVSKKASGTTSKAKSRRKKKSPEPKPVELASESDNEMISEQQMLEELEQMDTGISEDNHLIAFLDEIEAEEQVESEEEILEQVESEEEILEQVESEEEILEQNQDDTNASVSEEEIEEQIESDTNASVSEEENQDDAESDTNASVSEEENQDDAESDTNASVSDDIDISEYAEQEEENLGSLLSQLDQLDRR